MKWSELQIEKVSSYLLDISKLIFGASVVPLFVPNSQFSMTNFAFGVLIAGLSFMAGLEMLNRQKI